MYAYILNFSFLAVHRGGTVSANKALELVRAALQPSLNAEIEAVLKSYQEMFRMAAHNIKDNTRGPYRGIKS